jgi:hypothetical protein
MSPRAIAITLATAATALVGAPAAAADTTVSSNWAGYAVHRSNASFTKVIGTWTLSQPTCTAGRPTYSSAWVGLGGFSESAQALEQIGTEADCTASGRAALSAWYELVPAASRAVRLTVHGGDRVRASVSVSGHEVALTLADLTRHRSFTRTLRASQVDTSSAEWIVEAPSLCSDNLSCQTLPLADFGSTVFGSASATSATGHTGTIKDQRWSTTRISLGESGHSFVGAGPGTAGAGSATATASALTRKGSGFTITFTGSSTTGTTGPAAAANVALARIVHAQGG